MADQPDILQPASKDDLERLLGADLGEVPDSKWAPLLADMVRVLEALHIRGGATPEEAFRRASQETMALAEYFGGRVVYLPRGDRLKNALRDAEIFRRFKGSRNADELAVEYKLTTIHIYKIAREQKALHLRKLQGRLFKD